MIVLLLTTLALMRRIDVLDLSLAVSISCMRRRHLRLRIITLHGYKVSPELCRIMLHTVARFGEGSRARQRFIINVNHAVACPCESLAHGQLLLVAQVVGLGRATNVADEGNDILGKTFRWLQERLRVEYHLLDRVGNAGALRLYHVDLSRRGDWNYFAGDGGLLVVRLSQGLARI